MDDAPSSDPTDTGRTDGPAPPQGRLPPGLAAGLVFLSSGAVLVLEILALRLIAPYVGVTLETNTAVIGIALTAIAVGATAGGRTADRVDPLTLIGPLLLVSAVAAVLVLPAVRFTGALAGGGNPAAVLLLALVAIFVPAALLSAVTPMVVKLQLADLGSTGTVVGRLSGIGTVGAIAATFATGFLLVAALPTSVILLGLGALLGAAGAALQWRQVFPGGTSGPGGTGNRSGPGGTGRRRPVAMLGALVLAGGLLVLAPRPCDLETAYHCARVVTDPERAGGRVLELDTLRHSYVDLDDPTYLRFAYIQAMASAADVLRPAGEPLDALHVGGGGLTLPRYLAATRPGSRSRVLEIDPGVVRIDRRQLGLRTGADLQVRVGDGRVLLRDEPAGSRDLVVGDAFGGVAVPWHLATRETAREVRRVLRPDGAYAVNIIDGPGGRLVRAELATLRAEFPHVVVASERAAFAGAEGANFVLLASARPLPVSALAARLGERREAWELTDWELLDTARTADFTGGARALTDDFAPADQLLTSSSG